MVRKVIVSLVLLMFVAALFAGNFIVSGGKGYTLFPEPNPNYPDPSQKLTDGSYQFSWGDMVGWENPTTNPTIVIDLGTIYEEISFVGLKVMYSAPSGVNLPEGFLVSISEDGELFEDLGMGMIYAEAPVPNDTIATLYWASEDFVGYGQFVRIEALPGGEGWTMIAEVMVGNGLIPEELELKADVPTDLSEAEIVSIGAPYMLIPLPSSAYPDPQSIKVTDGFARYSWGDMIGFDSPSMNPTVIIDLLESKSIVKVSAHFMRSFASAVNLPNSLLISISQDGMDFRTVGLAVMTAPFPPENELINEIYWIADKPMEARFVQIEVRPRGEAWTMLAEATVWAVNP